MWRPVATSSNVPRTVPRTETAHLDRARKVCNRAPRRVTPAHSNETNYLLSPKHVDVIIKVRASAPVVEVKPCAHLLVSY